MIRCPAPVALPVRFLPRIAASCLATCTLFAAVVPARAQVDAAISRPPHWYSGTNCAFSGDTFTETFGTWLTSASILINGEATVSYTPDPTNHQWDWSALVVFDSTHFGDGSSATIAISAENNLGEGASYGYTIPVYNKGYDLLNQTLPDEYGMLEDVALDLGMYPLYAVQSSETDAKDNILENLPEFTALFVMTHGSDALFGDCFATSTQGDYLSADDVAYAVSQKGYGIPPYCFVYIYACSVLAGGDPTMSYAFGIFDNATDQACLGWPVDIAYGTANDAWCDDVWDVLCRQSETLGDAIRRADDHAAQTYGGSGCYQANFTPPKVEPVVIGDLAMKLHGVYGGMPGQWHLP